MAAQLTIQTPAAPALDELFVCPDCWSWLINGDATGLDHHYRGHEADVRLVQIQEGEADLMRTYGSLHMGCALWDDEFSSTPCDCCGSRLAGERHHMHAWQHRT